MVLGGFRSFRVSVTTTRFKVLHDSMDDNFEIFGFKSSHNVSQVASPLLLLELFIILHAPPML